MCLEYKFQVVAIRAIASEFSENQVNSSLKLQLKITKRFHMKTQAKKNVLPEILVL